MHHARPQRAGVGALMHHCTSRLFTTVFTLRKLPFTLSLVQPLVVRFLLTLIFFWTSWKTSQKSPTVTKNLTGTSSLNGPIAYSNASELEDEETSNLRCRSWSLQDLSEGMHESSLSRFRHSPSPMQGERASGSPLVLAGASPTPVAVNSTSTLTVQVNHIKK